MEEKVWWINYEHKHIQKEGSDMIQRTPLVDASIAQNLFSLDFVVKLVDVEGKKDFMIPAVQEEYVIRKDNFEKLSAEAKEVLWIVLDSPNEVFETFLTGKRKLFSKNLLQKHFLKKRKWKRTKVNKVFSEIKEYVKGL